MFRAADSGWALIARRRATVALAVWALLAVAALPLALHEATRLTTAGFEVPGSQSARVEREITRGIPTFERPSPLAVVLQPRTSSARPADYRAALAKLGQAAARTPGAALDPIIRGGAEAAAAHPPRRAIVLPLTVRADDFHAVEIARGLEGRLRMPAGARVVPVVIGQGALWTALVEQGRRDLRRAELLSLPLVLVILLLAFGTPLAAVLPLVIGVATIVVGEALVGLLAHVMVVSVFVANVASMIGLGVAIDYALFILVRYRQELAAGASYEAALATAIQRAGRAVAVSGLALVAALCGLLALGTAALSSIAVGAGAVVCIAMLAARTLLPALIVFAGPRIPAAGGGEAARRWTNGVLRRPAAAVIAGLAVLVALAAPALALRTGDGALRQLPRDNETRRATEAALASAGPGRASPLKVLVPPGEVARATAVTRADPEVGRTGIRARTRNGRYVLVVLRARDEADDARAKALVERLRRELPPGALVGGDSAAQVDFNHATISRLRLTGAWVVLVSGLLLLWLLRSARLAAVGLAANALSLAAALGVLTLVFVDGSPGYVDTVVLPVVLAVVFGLSMDYQIFLLSRVRERLELGDEPGAAIAAGLATNARAIVTAAAIMVAVFAAFIATGVPAVREIGVGAGVAVAVDATVVRLVLLPAALKLAFGRRGAGRTVGHS